MGGGSGGAVVSLGMSWREKLALKTKRKICNKQNKKKWGGVPMFTGFSEMFVHLENAQT